MLLGNPDTYPWMFEQGGFEKLARYADGVGPAHPMVVLSESTRGDIKTSDLVTRAHAAGLQVHPYTYRKDPGQVPAYAASFEELLEIHYFEAGVDGVFTDFPDLAVQFLRARQ